MRLALLAIGLVFAAVADPAEPTDPIPEVEINAQREKLSVMRAEMVKLEDRFYAEYNRLNIDDQFDVHCGIEASTGTRLESRVCTPVFVSRARADEAYSFLTGTPAPPATMVILAKSSAYDKNMLDVINKHPELRKLVKQREALGKRYEAVRKLKFKGKIIVLD